MSERTPANTNSPYLDYSKADKFECGDWIISIGTRKPDGTPCSWGIGILKESMEEEYFDGLDNLAKLAANMAARAWQCYLYDGGVKEKTTCPKCGENTLETYEKLCSEPTYPSEACRDCGYMERNWE